MATVTVPVHAPVIDWIVQNIHEDQIAPNVLNQLNAWKTGEKQPTLKQLEAMSKKHIFHSATSCCKRRPGYCTCRISHCWEQKTSKAES